MRLLKILFLCALIVSSSHAIAGNMPGEQCARLGATLLSDDQANIIACVKVSVSNQNLVWKTTFSDATCPTGQMVNSVVNGVPTCVVAVPANFSCTTGQIITGFVNGVPKCEAVPSAAGTGGNGCLPANLYMGCQLPYGYHGMTHMCPVMSGGQVMNHVVTCTNGQWLW